MSKSNVMKVLRTPIKNRKEVFKQIGIDGFSVSDLEMLAAKIGINIPQKRSKEIHLSGEDRIVSTKKDRFNIILSNL